MERRREGKRLSQRFNGILREGGRRKAESVQKMNGNPKDLNKKYLNRNSRKLREGLGDGTTSQ